MAEDDVTKDLTPEDDPTAGLSTNELLRQAITRLAVLETKVDERLKDTRPIWQAVEARL